VPPLHILGRCSLIHCAVWHGFIWLTLKANGGLLGKRVRLRAASFLSSEQLLASQWTIGPVVSKLLICFTLIPQTQ
jgi:hypothetical protein